MKRLIIAATIALLATPSLACSHPWLAFNGTTWVDTCDNTGSVAQGGTANVSSGVQDGDHNRYVEDVSGSGNVVVTSQTGSGNVAGTHITGDNNTAITVQNGTGAWSAIGMSGSGGTAISVQSN